MKKLFNFVVFFCFISLNQVHAETKALKHFMDCYSLPDKVQSTPESTDLMTYVNSKSKFSIIISLGSRAKKNGMYFFSDTTIAFYPFLSEWKLKKLLLESGKKNGESYEIYGSGYTFELKLKGKKKPTIFRYATEEEIVKKSSGGTSVTEKIANGAIRIEIGNFASDEGIISLVDGDIVDEESKGEYTSAIGSRFENTSFREWRSALGLSNDCQEKDENLVEQLKIKLVNCKNLGNETSEKRKTRLLKTIDQTLSSLTQGFENSCSKRKGKK